MSAAVLDDADRLTGPTARVAGATRYETARLAAEQVLAETGTAGTTWFATGRNYPDALVAGPAIAAAGGVLLLVDGTRADGDDARLFLREHADRTRQLVLLGGPATIDNGSRVERCGKARRAR